jgi:hypothetical protein
VVVPGGPLGFQVSVIDSDGGRRLVGDFSTHGEAETFAQSMRRYRVHYEGQAASGVKHDLRS